MVWLANTEIGLDPNNSVIKTWYNDFIQCFEIRITVHKINTDMHSALLPIFWCP